MGFGELGDEGMELSRFDPREKSEDIRLADLTGADNILKAHCILEKRKKIDRGEVVRAAKPWGEESAAPTGEGERGREAELGREREVTNK